MRTPNDHRIATAGGLCLLLLLATLPLRAQLPSLTFETLTVKDGLPGNTVFTATKDRQGFMWFGTRRCPTRYDGTSFRNFLDFETNFVTGLAADRANNLWAATDRAGVCRIAAHSLEMQAVARPPTGDRRTTGNFFIGSGGQGWYGDFDGVNRLDLKTGRSKHYAFRQTNYVWVKGSFLEDGRRNLWVLGTDNGLFRYDPAGDSLRCVLGADCPDPARREPIVFTRGCTDAEGILWLGTQSHGRVRYDPRTGAYRAFRPPGRSGPVNDVKEGWDENGRRILWVGNSESAGVFRPDQEQFYFFPGLFPEAYEVHDIFRDRQDGIVWVCTSAGILKYHPRGNLIRTVAIPPGLVPLPVTVNAFLPDRTDTSGRTWWLGLSHTGLLRWNRRTGTFALVRYPSGAVAETRWMTGRDDGTIWIGTNRWDYRGPGLFLFDPRKGQFLETPLSRLANRYYSVPFFMYGFVDPRERLWIGNSDEGLHVLDEGLNREVTLWPAGAARHLARHNNLINDVHCDRRGRVWLATYQGVYYVADDGRGFVSADSLTPAVRLEDPAVNTVYTDRRGNLWAARWGSVTQMDPSGRILTVLTSRDGLYDRENKGLAEDRSGNLWIGNYEGLHCYQPATRRLLRFTVNDGLLGDNTTGRITATPDGAEILVGQKNGFNVVQAAQLLHPHAPPALAVSSFKIEEQEQNLDFGGTVRIRPGQNAFSVDFTALNYARLHYNQYAYYLAGFESTWRPGGPGRRAYYANLDPGAYTLYVKAGDALGNWTPRPLQLRIRVLPAYYQTGWFRLLAAGVGAGLLYALYRYRVRQLLRVQRVRDRISADLHDEIGTTLSGVDILGVMARKGLPDGHPAAPLLERMNEEVHQVSGALDDIVWSINPRNDGPDRLLARMTRYASELLEARDIECHLALPAQPEHLKLPMEKRRDFYLFFKEAISNLAKYAGCTEAWIEISRHRQHLRLVVRDNGVGFDPAAPSERDGLRNLKKPAESLHGTCSIESLPGAGTTVRLEFPVPPAPKRLLTRTG